MSSLNLCKVIKVFFLLIILCNSLSLETVSDRVKRDANAELYPDWLPFKNEKGDDIGVLAETPTKAKPKKRLAPPVNFILRNVAEPEGDDYYDKGQGESDGEDYYEKKDWSDTNRPAENVQTSVDLSRVKVSDIEGLVNIITQPNPITEVLRKHKKSHQSTEVTSAENKEDQDDKKEKDDSKENIREKKEDDLIEEQKSEESKDIKKQQNNEDEADYEEESTENKKQEISDEEKRENEAKKARILSSVDDLKARHAQEQRIISEKVKEEEMYKEELERDKIKVIDESDKYGGRPRKTTDYDDYDEKKGTLTDKYKINHHKPTKPTTRKLKRITTRKPKPKNAVKYVESGKLSVFKNPRAYMVYDDDDSNENPTKTTKPATKPTRITKRTELKGRYSSKYSTPATNSEENVRISLVPEENEAKEGEPTMFFPKRRTKKRKQKTTTPAPDDSSVAESIPDRTAKDLITAHDVTSVDSTAPETVSTGESTAPTGEDTAPSAAEIAPESSPSAVDYATFTKETAPPAEFSSPSAVDSAPSEAAEAPSAVDAVDAVPASSDHKKDHKKGENYHHEKGAEREHHSEYDSSHEEHGKKAYEGVHKDTKTEKGHHDKEDHLGRYKDHGGIDKHHHDEKKHYGAHHHEEHGKKHAKYEESGKHSKGHSTKGSHDIHKKEEYEKNVEFFEEEGDSAEEEKHGGHNHERSHSSGGNFKKGNLDAAHRGHSKGDSGHFEKGGHGHGHKGHRGSAGHDSHGKYGSEHHSKEGKAQGKKWIYHHGSPAKTANLVVIDRRADQYYHGPTYYG